VARKRAPVKRGKSKRRVVKRAKPRRAAPRDTGIYLYVNVTAERVEILHAATVSRVHRGRGHLRAPVLVPGKIDNDDYSGETELVCSVLGQNGAVLDWYGWPAQAPTFCDSLGDPVASTVEPDRQARWRIPLQANARYLEFSRTELTRDAKGRPSFTHASLGVFDLKPGGKTRAGATPITLDAKTPASRARGLGDSGPPTSGYVKAPVALLEHGAPADKFNVVVLGDGFAEADLPVFDKYADLVKQMFVTKAPFAGLVNRINIYKVPVVSADSGITNCPTCGVARNTYFGSQGCWNGTTSPSFIGTASKPRVVAAAATAVPQSELHCIVVLANCVIYGGSAPPELGLVFLTMPGPPNAEEIFMDLAAHEVGHAIAHLNEEYNPCNEKKRGRLYPNEATQAEVDAGAVWWTSLASASEMVRGRLKVIHRFGDPVTPGGQPIVAPPANQTMLGTFWGCHNGDPPAPLPGTNRLDPRGQKFFRAMATCRMRDIPSEFCRVCASLLTDAVTDVSV